MEAAASALSPSDLAQFTGTEVWYRHPLIRSVLYTEGVKHFADRAGAYWLIDVLATELAKKQAVAGFLSINMTVKVEGGTRKAVIHAGDGNGRVLWTKFIAYTDCPVGEWRFYFTDNVILLPSEY